MVTTNIRFCYSRRNSDRENGRSYTQNSIIRWIDLDKFYLCIILCFNKNKRKGILMNNMVLKDNEAAIIFTEDNISIAIPHQEDEEFVPDYVKVCVGLAALWQNPETQPVLWKMIDDLYKEIIDKVEEDSDEEERGGC